jgi:hypothetical protein
VSRLRSPNDETQGIFGPVANSLTTEEINQTIWAFTGPLNILSGVSPLLGAIVAGVGISLYAGAKGSKVWKVGIGLFIVLIIALVATVLNFLFRSGFWYRGKLDITVVHRDTLVVVERTHGSQGFVHKFGKCTGKKVRAYGRAQRQGGWGKGRCWLNSFDRVDTAIGFIAIAYVSIEHLWYINSHS